MFVEAAIIIFLIFVVLQSTGSVNLNKFVKDNQEYFKTFKESDYEFLLKAKYGDGIDSDRLFNARIRDGAIAGVMCIFLFISYVDTIFIGTSKLFSDVKNLVCSSYITFNYNFKFFLFIKGN